MDVLTHVLAKIQTAVWGPPTLFLLMGTGLFFTIALGGLQVVKFPRALKCIFEKEDIQGSPRMVIAGHNYKAHFRNLSQLPIGAEVSYQTMDGKVTKFQVTEIVEIDAKNGSALEEGTWDLTLLTCNYDMSKRILARCVCVEV